MQDQARELAQLVATFRIQGAEREGSDPSL
jgi:hypothetical protein